MNYAKLLKLFLSIGLLGGLFACEETGPGAEGEMTGDLQSLQVLDNVGDFTALRLKGIASVHVNSGSVSGNPGDIKLLTQLSDSGNVQWTLQNGELRIQTKDQGLVPKDLEIFVFTNDLESVSLEGDSDIRLLLNLALDVLNFKIEGNSRLDALGIQADSLITKREGGSYAKLSSSLGEFMDSLIVSSDSLSFLYQNVEGFVFGQDGKIWMAELVDTLATDSTNMGFTLRLGEVQNFGIVGAHDLKNEGNGKTRAFDMPTRRTTIKNEGGAMAELTVLENLHARGEGQSVLYYRGSPVIESDLNGGAQIINDN